MSTQERETDVVVVGAGPTGLLLAGDLAAAGVRVTLVERRPRRISNLSRAFAVHARTLELFDARGLADTLEAKGRALHGLRLFGRVTLDLGALPSRFRHVLVIPQYEVERVLLERAAAAGVTLAYDTELLGLTQDGDGVTVEAAGPGGPVTLRAAYVVGCDGHRSAVRRAVGLPFPGRSVIRSMVLADVRLGDEPADLLTVGVRDDAFCFVAPFGDGYYRVIGWRWGHDVDEDAPLELEEVRAIMRQALGTDHGMIDARWTSRFHSDERQVPAYRTGRVLLAGDAAHVHSPAGGQGMNTGLQDAANLSWKLAEMLRGKVAGADGESLLDSYHAERHPVGRVVVLTSGGILRAARARGLVSRVLGVVIAVVMGHVAPARRRAMGIVTGIGFAYRRPRGAHRLVGRRAPDVPLVPGASGTRLYEALRERRFVRVVPSDAGGALPAAGSREAGWAAGAVVVQRADGDPTALLVRPDGYVAWAA